MASLDQSLKVKVGCRVELELISAPGNSERIVLDIVPDDLADYDSGLLGQSTPMSRAIMGKPAGQSVSYHMGDLVAVRILSVETGQAQMDESAARQRKEAAQKAALEVDQTNAVVFASSFSGKWGDYDPSGMEKWDKTEKPDGPDEQDQPFEKKPGKL